MTQSGWATHGFAESWKSGMEARNRVLAAATERMFNEARVGSGSYVLDVGTGTGDTALIAAERVGPTGRVVATDASAAMVETAAATVLAMGLKQVQVRVMDASTVDMPQGSFDAVVARNVLMFVPIPRAISGFHRVLRRGGRLAAVVWSTLAANPFHRLVLDAARAHGGWRGSPPEVARAFALGDANMYRRTLDGAGYREVAVHVMPSLRRFASAREALETIRASPIHAAPIEGLPEGKRASAWEDIAAGLREFERGGACEIPLESLVVVGEK